MELDNSQDKYAVAVKNQDGNLVGHVPKELSRLFHKFLDDFGELEAECIGNRLNALWAMMKLVQLASQALLHGNESPTSATNKISWNIEGNDKKKVVLWVPDGA
ncbi:hypothetical protein pdam_00014674 [Pocillopora damicornis]|uniref:HIRAN domain-containing protein n=1 Tax=Pocillopora damicornis TaxID=46731 RepID=A0A3M6U3B3_POCDA|nr:hypothetical protein pdam_00014674 [Pocillopora damicornis]